MRQRDGSSFLGKLRRLALILPTGLLLAGLAACHSGSDNGGSSSISAASALMVSSIEKVDAVVNGGAVTASIAFNTNESAPLTDLSVTSGLSSLPAGWSGPATFSCASVSTGNGCVLNLTYAPTALAQGTLTIAYGYKDASGTARTGSATIDYEGTTNNNVVATPSPAGQIVAVVGGSRAMTVTFTTDDGNPATGLTVSTNLAALPAGWTSSKHSFTCASVSTGNGCQLPLTFAPTAYTSGTLGLNYSYTNDFGTVKSGVLHIAYAGTVHDNVAGISNPASVTSAVGNPTVDVPVTFTTDDGHPAGQLTVTSGLTSLPAGWSSTVTSFACTSVSAGTLCQLPLRFTAAIGATGTLQIGFSYVDDAGSAKTGTVNIAYTSTTHDTVVGAPPAGGTVRAAVGDSLPVPVTFTTNDGNVASNLSVTSGLSNLPNYWTGPAHFTCSSVSTGSTCQLTLTFAPLATVNGTVTLGYSYTDSAGTAKTGTVAVPYAVKHVYVSDYNNGIYVCSIVSGGALSGCTVTAAGRTLANHSATNSSYGIAFANDYAYINQYPDASESVCAVNPSDGTLTDCSLFAIPSGNYGYAVFATPDYLYIGNATSDVCPIGSNGVPTGCQSVSGNASEYATGIYVGPSHAYLSAFSGDLQICTVTGSGDLTPCVDSGISQNGGLTVSGNFAFITPYSSAAVYSCPINANGTLGACISSSVPGSNQGNGVGTAVFATNSYTVTATDVKHCAVNLSTGALSACAVSDGGATFSSPVGVTIY